MGKTRKKYTIKRKKSKAVFKAADFLEEGRIAFLDSEYVTSQKKGGPPAKLVSLGMVICRENFEEVERFHSYIYNDEPLHDKFRELTGITEEELLQAPPYEQVMKEVARKLRARNVRIICVWGPDQQVISQDLKYYRTGISKHIHKTVSQMLEQMRDIEGIYSRKLNMHSIGIANLKLLCGLGSSVSHDALEDAVDLKNVIAYLDVHGCPERAAQMLRQYMKEKELYYRYRRFHEKWDGISEAVVRKSRELINELEKSGMMEARALLDDLRVICTGEDSSFEEPEEYMERMKEK